MLFGFNVFDIHLTEARNKYLVGSGFSFKFDFAFNVI